MPTIPTNQNDDTSVFDGLLETLLNRVRDLRGAPDISDIAPLGMPVAMAATNTPRVLRVGDSVLKKLPFINKLAPVGEAQSAREILKMEKPFEKPVVASGVEDLKTFVPVAVENEEVARRAAPPLSGKWNLRKGETGIPAANMARSKLNTTMVKDIRTRGVGGEHVTDIMKDYPDVNKQTLLDIIKGRSWVGVK